MMSVQKQENAQTRTGMFLKARTLPGAISRNLGHVHWIA